VECSGVLSSLSATTIMGTLHLFGSQCGTHRRVLRSRRTAKATTRYGGAHIRECRILAQSHSRRDGGSKTDSLISSRGNPSTIRAGSSHVTELPQDFCDLLVELADAGAEFVLVGGHAVAFHGHPRATKDMDVLIRTARSTP
jgi:hypothetical protein